MESDAFKIPTQNVPVQSKASNFKAEPEKKVIVPQNNINELPCPYIEPPWSKLADPRINYDLEVLKNGVIVEEIKNLQTKKFWTFGRLESCDIYLAHPSISRFHTVLQYRPKLEIEPLDDETKIEAEVEKEEILSGWYIYDLGSTHGSFLNKKQIPSKSYIRVKVGHMIQLGGSTRRFILKGPDYDEEEESALSITEAKQLKLQKSLELIERREVMDIENQKIEESKKGDGINWGMGEDADEETDLTINPYATTNNEELFLDDPKKTLRGFFDREGLELNYNVDEMSPGTFVCRIDLPIDDANGRQIIAEVCHKGKKKDAVLQGALEACRILDRHGVLRTATHESRKRKQNTSDSDEDEFWDRTGDVERRKQRKEAANKISTVNYDDLKQEESELVEKMSDLQAKIDNYHAIEKERKQAEEDDDLDSFMLNLSKEKPIDKLEVRKLRLELQRLQKDQVNLQKLIKIAAPVKLPPLLTTLNTNADTRTMSAESKKKFNFPLFGKRNKLPNMKSISKPINDSKPNQLNVKSDEEDEIEEDEPPEAKSKEPISAVKSDSIVDKKKNKEPLSQIKGPAFIPPKIIKNLQNSPKNSEQTETSNSALVKRDIDNDDEIDTNCSFEVAQPKKKRSRQRARDKYRDNVDMSEDIEEDVGKYSKWVPPENQAGDGYTELNKKFGY